MFAVKQKLRRNFIRLEMPLDLFTGRNQGLHCPRVCVNEWVCVCAVHSGALVNSHCPVGQIRCSFRSSEFNSWRFDRWTERERAKERGSILKLLVLLGLKVVALPRRWSRANKTSLFNIDNNYNSRISYSPWTLLANSPLCGHSNIQLTFSSAVLSILEGIVANFCTWNYVQINCLGLSIKINPSSRLDG